MKKKPDFYSVPCLMAGRFVVKFFLIDLIELSFISCNINTQKAELYSNGSKSFNN